MEFLEKDLEDIIFNTSTKKLLERGLRVNGRRFRQLRIGNYGIADMVTIKCNENTVYITVYELKKNQINYTTLSQATRYIQGIKKYLEKRNNFFNCEIVYSVQLVGKSINTSDDFIYLINFIDDVDVFIYEYDFDGIKFTIQDSWDLIDRGF